METNLALKPEQIEQEANSIVIRATSIVVKSPETYEQAASCRKILKNMIRKAEDVFDPIVEKTRAAWKEALSSKAKVCDPLETADRLLKSGMEGYDTEQARVAQAEQDRINRLAREQEEKERAKLDAQANKAIEKGNLDKAEELLQQKEQVYVPTATVQSASPTVDKITKVRDYEVIIQDINKIPDEYITKTVKLAALKALGKATDGKAKVPGVLFKTVIRNSIR